MGCSSRLTIKDLNLLVNLGCSEQERALPQEVRVDLELQFAEGPWACETDRLEDTLCYAKLAEVITAESSSKKFHTVEHLAFCCHKKIQPFFAQGTKSKITVHKVRPPVPHLKGGVFFTYGDLI